MAAYRALGRPLRTLLVAGYGLASFMALRLPRRGADVCAVACYRNERRQFDHLESVSGMPFAHIVLAKAWMLDPRSWGAALRALRRARDAWGLLREYDRGDFLVAARVASTIGYYLRFEPWLRRRPIRAIAVSSDSNPYAMALWAAARQHGLRTIYVTHGHLPEDPPRLDFDLSVLDGPALRRVYERSQGLSGHVVYRGSEGAYRPLDCSGLSGKVLRLGVFLSLVVDWDRLRVLLDALRLHLRPARLRVRLHPNEVVRPDDVAHRLGPDVEISWARSVLLEDAAVCDLVVAGNSSCHLTVLKYGVPTLYVRGLDSVPHDFYRFLESRIVAGVERVEDIDLDAVAAFYADPAWGERFTDFDGSYPGRDLGPEVGAALRAIVGR